MVQFLGRSDKYSSSVGLVHNLLTNAVSAQLHFFCYNHFSAVISDYTSDHITLPPAFHNLSQFSRDNHYGPEDVIVKYTCYVNP